jgi:D-glycero-alpha-D-manno-heptose-7-phosphate kinase
MIITRTPFRITLGGGGTDLPSYYEKHGGFIFAMGIDKYMYVMTNPPGIDRKIRLHYTQSEVVSHVSEVRHELAREALRFHGIEDGMEIASMADLPAGTGVGSSSSYLVGLLQALHHYRRDYVSLERLAEEACFIELKLLKKRIGKQDQYMAAFGGLATLDIMHNGDVDVSHSRLRESAVGELIGHTHLYYTGLLRNAPDMLAHQDAAMRGGVTHGSVVEESLNGIKELGYRIKEAVEDERFDAFGLLLHEHWERKKRLSDRVSLPWIDEVYEETRRRFGVLGGKIVGAGGGGFLMLFCPGNSRRLEDFMAAKGMPRLYYGLEREGAKVVANVASTQSMVLHPPCAEGPVALTERA